MQHGVRIVRSLVFDDIFLNCTAGTLCTILRDLGYSFSFVSLRTLVVTSLHQEVFLFLVDRSVVFWNTVADLVVRHAS